jgi:Zn finger protein HypA/HybF involved in hydrogenase expression
MSSKRLDTISDFTRHGYSLRVDCRSCKRLVIIDPRKITLLCQRRNWSRQLAAVERRLRCSQCGSRDVRLVPGFSSQ